MKKSEKILENYTYNKKIRSHNGALTAEKYRIYNHPNAEDQKLYHEIKFKYKKHNKGRHKTVIEERKTTEM